MPRKKTAAALLAALCLALTPVAAAPAENPAPASSETADIGAVRKIFNAFFDLIEYLEKTTADKSAAPAPETAENPGTLPQKIEDNADILHRFSRLLFVRQAVTDRLPPPEHYVKLRDVADSLRWAILAVEDRKFYSHPGIDIEGVLRAILVNIQEGEVAQGGSTITQQLIKTVLLSPRQDVGRKIEEVVLAIALETRCSKDEILEFYLNTIYFGSGFYGLKDASYGYFGKSPAELNLAEAALLAGLPNAPSLYSPYVNFSAAKERQRAVLDAMVSAGYISAAKAADAKNQPLVLVQ